MNRIILPSSWLKSMDGSFSCSQALEFGGCRVAGGWPCVGQREVCIGEMLHVAVSWGLAGRGSQISQGTTRSCLALSARAGPAATWSARANDSAATGNHRRTYPILPFLPLPPKGRSGVGVSRPQLHSLPHPPKSSIAYGLV